MVTRITVLIALASLLCSSLAIAAPTRLNQQGRLLDGDGVPLTGSHGLAFTLHDAETDGNEVWREERVVEFEEGYYSLVLGELVPLSDLVFAAGPVWLELSVNGAVLSPRHEVVSVPYALRAAVAEAVEGGAVDADEVSIGGNVVIDSSGNWLGTPPDWSELTGVPPDLADGDADSDVLLALPCADGYVAKYRAALGAWDCAEDNDSLAALICLTGEIPVYDVVAGLWVCGADLNTNTQLTEAQVDAFVANNDYSTGPHTTDTDTQLSQTEVLSHVQSASVNLVTGSAVGGRSIVTRPSVCVDGEVLIYSAGGNGWVCGVDTDTTLTPTEVQAMVEVMSLNLQNLPQVNGDDMLTVASTLDPTRIDAGGTTQGQVLTSDGSTAGWEDGGEEACLVVGSIIGSPVRLRLQCGDVNFIVEGSTLNANALASDSRLAAQFHCALDNNNAVQCWGRNNYGQVTGAPSGTFSSIVLGRNFGCALNAAGTVQCWGADHWGVVSSVPTGTFTSLQSAADFVCGITTGGSISCWGEDDSGSVTGTPSGSFNFLELGRYNGCAIDTSGSIHCWGRDQGQVVSNAPSSGSFVSLAMGDHSACAMDAAGALQCWGDLSYGGTTPSGTFASIHAGTYVICGLRTNGSPECWGASWYGQITGLPTGSYVDMSIGDAQNCVLTSAGDVECWGHSSYIDGTPTGASFSAIQSTLESNCGILDTGEVICWGNSGDGQTNPP
jgi:hypothetical protein